MADKDFIKTKKKRKRRRKIMKKIRKEIGEIRHIGFSLFRIFIMAFIIYIIISQSSIVIAGLIFILQMHLSKFF
jgi:hypothetical protein